MKTTEEVIGLSDEMKEVLTTLAAFKDKSATEDEIRAVIFLSDQIATNEALLALLFEHRLTAVWNDETDEPEFSNGKNANATR